MKLFTIYFRTNLSDTTTMPFNLLIKVRSEFMGWFMSIKVFGGPDFESPIHLRHRRFTFTAVQAVVSS